MIAAADPNRTGAEPPSLFAMLAVRARRAPDVALAALAGVGGIAAVILLAAQPSWWMFALPLVSAGAFGLWGILERATAEQGALRSVSYDRAMDVAQWVAAAIGTACAIVTAFAVFGILLGTITT
jgi:hypothetical protein